MKTKLDLAHEWYMKNVYQTTHEKAVVKAWDYADAMYEQLEKRESKGTPEAISGAEITNISNWQPSDLGYMNSVLESITSECNHEWDHISAYGGDGDYYVCSCGAEKRPVNL